jgi:hypothetical protein
MGNAYYNTQVYNDTDEAVSVVFTDAKRNPTKFVLDPKERKTIPTNDGSDVTLSAHRLNGGTPNEAQITVYQGINAEKKVTIKKKSNTIEFSID